MSEPPLPEPVSHRTLSIALAVSLIVAAFALVLIILPQSYGLDVTGLGAALGFEPAPTTDAFALDEPRASTVLIGANRTFAFPLALVMNETVHILWNSTGPLNATLTRTDAAGETTVVPTPWQGNATWQTTTFAAPDEARYHLRWHNAGTAPATVQVRVSIAH